MTSKLHKTLSSRVPVFVGEHWFSINRLSDAPDGAHRVEVLTKHPHHNRLLTSRSLHENERHEVFPGVFITVRDASEQSRVRVLIEAPVIVRITHDARSKRDVVAASEGLLLRRVQLTVPGALYLWSMPGRYEPFEEFVATIERYRIPRIVCLSPPDEISKKSPTYAEALSRGVAWHHDLFPILDYGVPADAKAFWSLASKIASLLQGGEQALIHCGAGIGRTGTFAVAVAMKLGLSFLDAMKAVKAAGSGPETPGQRSLLSEAKF